MTAGENPQGAVFNSLPVNGQTGRHRAVQILVLSQIPGSKACVLMEAVRGVLRSRWLPMNLMRHLPDVVAQKGLQHFEVLRATAHTLHERADPRGPMRLKNHPPPGFGVVEYLEQEIPVAVGCVVLQPLRVDPVYLGS